MVDREAKRAEGKGIGYDRWAAVHNLKQMAATMSVYEESGFSSRKNWKPPLPPPAQSCQTSMRN